MEKDINNISNYKYKKIRLYVIDNQLFLCLFNVYYSVIIINI